MEACGLRKSQLGASMRCWRANALSDCGESAGWLKPMLTTLNWLVPKMPRPPSIADCSERVVRGQTWKQPV